MQFPRSGSLNTSKPLASATLNAAVPRSTESNLELKDAKRSVRSNSAIASVILL
jgi:hypothetical protein